MTEKSIGSDISISTYINGEWIIYFTGCIQRDEQLKKWRTEQIVAYCVIVLAGISPCAFPNIIITAKRKRKDIVKQKTKWMQSPGFLFLLMYNWSGCGLKNSAAAATVHKHELHAWKRFRCCCCYKFNSDRWVRTKRVHNNMEFLFLYLISLKCQLNAAENWFNTLKNSMTSLSFFKNLVYVPRGCIGGYIKF